VRTDWQPPSAVDLDAIHATSPAVEGLPDLEIERTFDVFRIESAGLPWDLGMAVYEPVDPAQARVGADGRRAGIFLLHGRRAVR
jgi:hypothetical protein